MRLKIVLEAMLRLRRVCHHSSPRPWWRSSIGESTKSAATRQTAGTSGREITER
jgi:hypothetical protein